MADKPSIGEDMEELTGIESGTTNLENNFSFSYKVKRTTSIWSTLLFPGICLPKEFKSYIYIKTCTQMFTEALLVISKNRKPLNIHVQIYA